MGAEPENSGDLGVDFQSNVTQVSWWAQLLIAAKFNIHLIIWLLNLIWPVLDKKR